METAEFISFAWRDYIQGKVGIENVLATYEEHGFDCNQDIPGNILWEDLYRLVFCWVYFVFYSFEKLEKIKI